MSAKSEANGNVRSDGMNKAISQKTKQALRQELADYSPYYDAHKDILSTPWDQAESVNRLLKLLRQVCEEIGEE